MRKAGIAAGVLVALIVVALLVAPLFIDVNQYRPQIEAQAQQALGRQISLGEMRLRLLLPKVSISNVAVAEDPAFGAGTFATIPEMTAWLSVRGLLSGEMRLSSLTLQQPSVQLIRNPQGVWNFASLGKGSAEPKPETAGAGLPVSNFEIVNGRVSLADRQKGFQGTYENINVNVDGFAPDKAFDVEAAMMLPGTQDGRVELDANIGPLQAGNMIATPIDGEVTLENASVASLQALANQEGSTIGGIASGTLKVRNTGSAFESNGDLTLSSATVNQVTIGYPIELEYKVSGNLNDEVYRIEEGTLKLGSTPFSLLGTIEAAPTPMRVDLKLSTNDASLKESARLASAMGVAFHPGMDVEGRLTANVQAQGPVDGPALSGSVTARKISISGGELKQPVEVPELQLTLTPETIRSNPFTASSRNTRLQGQITLTNYTSEALLLNATLSTSGAELGELISIAQAYGVETAEGMSGSGQASLDLRASGPVKNASALQFSGSGQLRNVSLKPSSLAEPIRVSQADLKFTQNSMTVQNLAASLASTNAQGNLTLSNFAAPRVQFTLKADQIDVTRLQKVMEGGSTPAQAWLSLIPAAHAQTKAAEPGLLQKMTGQGDISVGKILYDGLVLSNVQSKVQLDRGVVRMSPVSASLFGGQQTGVIVLDARTTPMQIGMESRVQKVQANDLISAVSSLDQTIYGLLGGNAQANFRAGESANIASTLNGKVSMDLSDGKIAGIDLLNRLSQVARFTTGVETPGNFTSIVHLTGDFDVKNGVAQTNNLRAEIPGANVAADGSVNLATNALSMRVTAVLPKDTTQRVGGTGIGGFMNTALANRNGELVIPVVITGTFDNPSVAPDVQKIAEMKLQNLLPTSANPGSLTSGVLGTILGGQQNSEEQRKKGIGGIVDAITGSGQKAEPQKNANQPTEPGTQPEAEKKAQPARNPLGGLLDRVLGGKSDQKSKQPEEQPKQ